MITRALAHAVPPLARAYNVPVRAVRAVDVASHVIEDITEASGFVPSGEERDLILIPAMDNDTGATSGNPEGQSVLWRQAALLEGCSVTGHMFTILRDSDGALVNFNADAPNWNYGKARRLRRRIAGPGLHTVIEPGRSYYHFFGNEFLPLLSYLDRLHDPDEALNLIIAHALPAYQRAALAALCAARPNLRLMELAADELLSDARLIWIFQLHANYDWMPATRDEASRLTDIFRHHLAVAAPAEAPIANRLFVSRRDAKIRLLKNEKTLEAMLAESGFTTFVPGKASLAEQVDAFGRADIVVSVHGAALTNLLFCRPGTLVIEIFPANFVKSTYLWLAKRLGLEYRAVVGEEGDYMQNFAVDSAAIAKLIAAADEASAPRRTIA